MITFLQCGLNKMSFKCEVCFHCGKTDEVNEVNFIPHYFNNGTRVKIPVELFFLFCIFFFLREEGGCGSAIIGNKLFIF